MKDKIFEHVVSEPELRSHLGEIFASKPFRNSEKLRRLLTYLVEAHVAGEDAKLKGYTIGIEALARPDDFDPQLDPIVRVQAKRLRDGLDRFYATDGKYSQFRILIEKGSYRPVFTRVAVDLPLNGAGTDAVQCEPMHHTALEKPQRSVQTRLAFALGLSIAALTGVAGLVAMVARGPGMEQPGRPGADPTTITSSIPKQGNANQASERRSRFNGFAERPAIRVFSKEPEIKSRGDLNVVVAALSRFGIFQVQHSHDVMAAGDRTNTKSVNQYTLSISGCPGCPNESLTATLEYVPTNETIYSRSFPVVSAATQQTIEKIIRSITALDGPILTHTRKVHEGNISVFGCYMEVVKFAKTFSPEVRDRIRLCISEYARSGESDPFMEQLSAFDALLGYWLLEEQQNNLARAHKHSRRALELDPNMPLGYFVRAFVSSGFGNLDHAVAMAKQGYELNPVDTLMAFGYGNALLSVGDFKTARIIMESTRDDSNHTPVWVGTKLALAYLLENNLPAFASVVHEIQGTQTPLGRMLVLIAAAQQDDPSAIMSAYNDIKSIFPILFRTQLARQYLNSHFRNATISGHVIKELEKAMTRAEEILRADKSQ